MGILQRIYSRAAPTVWEAETSLLQAWARTRAPVAVQWIVTSACDLHCPHCYSAAGRRAPDELTTDEARTLVIDALASLGPGPSGRAPTLVFAGGEMSLRRDMPALIRHTVARGLPYAIHSHGGHMRRLAEVFAEHPPDLAAISLDGDEAAHDGFRGRKGSFAAALEAIEILAACGCREIVVGTTVTRHSADRLVDLFPIVAGSGAHTWGLHLFAPEGRGAEHQALLPTPMQLRRVVEFARRRRASFHVELCNEWGGAGDDDRFLRDQPFACGAGRISCVIASNGDVMPCTTTDPAEAEGNVRDQSFASLWASGFTRFRRPGSDATVDPAECWLQTRNGVEIRRHAFAGIRDRAPLPIERLTRQIVARLPSRPGKIASARASQAVRWAAIGLTFLDACTQKPEPPPTPTPTEPNPAARRPTTTYSLGVAPGFPEDLAKHPAAHFGMHGPAGHVHAWQEAMRLLVRADTDPQPMDWANVEATIGAFGRAGPGPAALAELLLAHARARAAGETSSLGDLIGMLNALEAIPSYDAAFASYLWRRARSIAPETGEPSVERVVLFARLHRHLRVAESLVHGEAETAPVEFSAWRSKAAPPVGWLPQVTVSDGLVAAAKRHFDDGRPIGWDRVAVTLELEQGDAVMIRDAIVHDVRSEVTLGRLDVLWARSEVQLRSGDRVVRLPAGAVVTLDRLAAHVDDATRERFAAAVDQIAAGDARAEAEAPAMVPWLQGAMRTWVSTHALPEERAGVDRLRMLLVAFDE